MDLRYQRLRVVPNETKLSIGRTDYKRYECINDLQQKNISFCKISIIKYRMRPYHESNFTLSVSIKHERLNWLPC
jgi:hypothetical protein